MVCGIRQTNARSVDPASCLRYTQTATLLNGKREGMCNSLLHSFFSFGAQFLYQVKLSHLGLHE